MTPGGNGEDPDPLNGAETSPQPLAGGADGSSHPPERPRTWVRLIGLGVMVLGIVALAWYVNRHAAQSTVIRDAVETGGYPMLLALSAASGFNLAVPIPIVSFFPFLLEIGFHPGWALAAIALGMTVGDLVGFLLGAAGRRALEGREIAAFRRLEQLRDRHRVLPLLALFLYASLAPIPNELMVIPMALLGYPLLGVGSALLAGNVLFNGLFALASVGFFGAVG